MLNTIDPLGGTVFNPYLESNSASSPRAESPGIGISQPDGFASKKLFEHTQYVNDMVDVHGTYSVLNTRKDTLNQGASEIRALGEAKTLVSRVKDSRGSW